MHCWPRTLLWLVIAVIGLFNLLSACGQKGPLYLPPADQAPSDEEVSER